MTDTTPSPPADPPPAAERAAMRRCCWKLAAFVAIAAGQLAVAEALVRQLPPPPAARKLHEVQGGTTDWEGLVLGTSHAAHGIRPADLDRPGRRWYNLGFQGAPPGYFHDLWALYRATGRKPRRVVYVCDWFVASGSLTRRLEQDGAWLTPANWGALLLTPERPQPLLLANSLALAQRRPAFLAWLTRAQGAVPGLQEHVEAYDRGYVPLTRSGMHPARATESANAWPKRVAALERQLAGWRAEGVDVTLVQAPEYTPLSPWQDKAHEAFAAMAGRLGVPFLDYNAPDRRDALNEDPTAFVDWGHLNDAGARRFSRRLGVDLAGLPLKTGSR